MSIDFLSIGDATVDDFIRIKDASLHCDINKEACTICLRFADKVPFESSTIVYGVGNAGNAAISATRLGLKTAFITNIGKDQNGDKIVDYYKQEGLDTSFVTQHADVPTNYHYVLWYEDERTILVKQNPYQYVLPSNLPIPKAVYFSSVKAESDDYRNAVSDFLEANPTVFFAFQPGVFEIKTTPEHLKRFYTRANFFVCNKEEASRVTGIKDTSDVEVLAKAIQALGPKIVVVTDGRNGAYALEGGTFFHVPMYPDPARPIERTGAGDAFASTTAAYLSQGMPLKNAMLRGMINSAYVVQEVGAQKGLLTKERMEELATEAEKNY